MGTGYLLFRRRIRDGVPNWHKIIFNEQLFVLREANILIYICMNMPPKERGGLGWSPAILITNE